MIKVYTRGDMDHHNLQIVHPLWLELLEPPLIFLRYVSHVVTMTYHVQTHTVIDPLWSMVVHGDIAMVYGGSNRQDRLKIKF